MVVFGCGVALAVHHRGSALASIAVGAGNERLRSLVQTG